MSLPSDREIIRILSRRGMPWYKFAALFGAQVIAESQRVAVERGIVSSNSRGKDLKGDHQGREYFKSFGVKLQSDGVIVFYNDAAHAVWLEQGNDPGGGWIYPRKAQFLRFQGNDGTIVYARRVRAFKPYNVMKDSTDNTIRRMARR